MTEPLSITEAGKIPRLTGIRRIHADREMPGSKESRNIHKDSWRSAQSNRDSEHSRLKICEINTMLQNCLCDTINNWAYSGIHIQNKGLVVTPTTTILWVKEVVSKNTIVKSHLVLSSTIVTIVTLG